MLEDAERGDAESQCLLGEMHRLGDGVQQGQMMAARWRRKAAEQGDEKAKEKLSRLGAR